MINDVRFLKKGIKHGGIYTPVWYSKGSYTKESRIPEGTITIYAKEYSKGLPRILQPINESDGMTDYFEKDKVRITPTNKLYKKISKFI